VELPVVEPITERLPLAFSQSSAITGRYLKFTIPCSIYECEQKTPLFWCMGKPIIILEHSLYKRTLFPSIKGLGAPVRMVILPKEAHGYVPREYITSSLGTRSILRKISEELILKPKPRNTKFQALV
jgi:hypothetical protein